MTGSAVAFVFLSVVVVGRSCVVVPEEWFGVSGVTRVIMCPRYTASVVLAYN